jgi:hypothetical protein
VFAFQAAAACNLDCRPKRLRDELTGLPMLRSIPVLSLMLELQHGRPPANTCIRSESTATRGPHIAVGMLLHISIVEAQPPRVMTFVHHAALVATQADSNSVSKVPSQLEQRPGRTGARCTVSDRPHMTQYRHCGPRRAAFGRAFFRGCFRLQREVAMHTVPVIRLRCVLHIHHGWMGPNS